MITNATLKGSGTVRGSVLIRNGGFLSIGDDVNVPETMTITNALTFQPTANLSMDVDWYLTQASLTNDVIQGLNSVTYGGILNLNLVSIDTNAVFKLFSAASYSGAFASITPAFPPFSPAIWGWDTSQLTTNGTLRIAAHIATVTRQISSVIVPLCGSAPRPASSDIVMSALNFGLFPLVPMDESATVEKARAGAWNVP